MSAADGFSSYKTPLDGPADDAAAVTPSDSVDLANVSRGLYVGTGGDLTVITKGGTTILFKAVPSGTLLPIRVSRVKATGTAAADIVALT